jgi:hypothetical protein
MLETWSVAGQVEASTREIVSLAMVLETNGSDSSESTPVGCLRGIMKIQSPKAMFNLQGQSERTPREDESTVIPDIECAKFLRVLQGLASNMAQHSFVFLCFPLR